MNKEQKTQLISEIKDNFTKSKSIVLLQYRGMSDLELYNFRKELRLNNSRLKIAKNTLIKIAISDTKLNGLNPYLSGPIAFIYSDDPISVAKIVTKSSKENEFIKFQACYMDESILSEDKFKSLSQLGSLNEIRSSFISILKSSQSNFVRTLNSQAQSTISLLNNYISKKEE